MTPFCAAAWLALAFMMIHTSSMIVAFAGAENGKPLHRFGPSALHLVAALLVNPTPPFFHTTHIPPHSLLPFPNTPLSSFP